MFCELINTSREVWKDLCQRYDRGDAYRLSDLLEAFHCQKRGNLSMDEYYTRLLWDEIMMLRPIPTCECNPILSCTCDVMKKESSAACEWWACDEVC